MNWGTATRQWLEKIVGLRWVTMSACSVAMLWSLPKMALAVGLMETLHQALANDSVYAMAKANRDAGQEKLPLGRGGLLPSVTLSANKAWNDLSNNSNGFKTRYISDGYSVQLTQPLFNWPAWEGYKQGELLVAMSEAQFITDTQDLMVRVAQAYFDVLAARNVLDAQESLKAASLEQLELTKSSLDAGTVPITDVNEAQSRFDLASAQVIGAKNDLEVKRFALGRITGSEPEKLAGLGQEIVLAAPQPTDMKNWTDAAVKENPAVKAKQLGFEYAMREVSRNAGAKFPTLDLVTSRQDSRTVNTFNGTPNNTDQNTFMLQMNLPLYSGGRLNAKEREAVALKERARADLQDTTRTIVQAVRQNYLGVMSGLAQLKGLESAGVSSASALDSIKAGYEIGVRANVDVLNAQSQVADVRQRLVRARVETLLSLLRLKAAAGQLAEHDLVEIDALLEH